VGVPRTPGGCLSLSGMLDLARWTWGATLRQRVRASPRGRELLPGGAAGRSGAILVLNGIRHLLAHPQPPSHRQPGFTRPAWLYLAADSNTPQATPDDADRPAPALVFAAAARVRRAIAAIPRVDPSVRISRWPRPMWQCPRRPGSPRKLGPVAGPGQQAAVGPATRGQASVHPLRITGAPKASSPAPHALRQPAATVSVAIPSPRTRRFRALDCTSYLCYPSLRLQPNVGSWLARGHPSYVDVGRPNPRPVEATLRNIVDILRLFDSTRPPWLSLRSLAALER